MIGGVKIIIGFIFIVSKLNGYLLYTIIHLFNAFWPFQGRGRFPQGNALTFEGLPLFPFYSF